MTDQVYALIFAVLAGGLLTAMVTPAPAHAMRDEAGAHLALLAAACLATIVMGVLALLGLPAESTVCGAVAWLLVMPCVWLARAPRSADGWRDEEEDYDDDGGSPSPGSPSAPPAPDDWLPGPQRSAAPAWPAAWSAPPRATPVTATAATVQRMLAAQEAQTLRAAAARVALPLAAHVPDGVAQLPATAPSPALAPATESRSQAALGRPREDRDSRVHVRAAYAHPGRRRRASLWPRLMHRCRLWLWPAPPECTGRPRRAAAAPAADQQRGPATLVVAPMQRYEQQLRPDPADRDTT